MTIASDFSLTPNSLKTDIYFDTVTVLSAYDGSGCFYNTKINIHIRDLTLQAAEKEFWSRANFHIYNVSGTIRTYNCTSITFYNTPSVTMRYSRGTCAISGKIGTLTHDVTTESSVMNVNFHNLVVDTVVNSPVNAQGTFTYKNCSFTNMTSALIKNSGSGTQLNVEIYNCTFEFSTPTHLLEDVVSDIAVSYNGLFSNASSMWLNNTGTRNNTVNVQIP